VTWETTIFAAVALVFLFLLLWLLREPPSRAGEPLPAGKGQPLPAGPLQIENLFPLHCRHYPQMRQVFLNQDEEFLRRRASARIRRRWRDERQRVALGFLAGLREDFQNLSRLAREAARLSPKLSEKQEAELLWLRLRFQALYLMVQLRLRFGLAPLGGLTQLANMVGNLASGVEKIMASLEEASVAQLRPRQPGLSGS
jgi:hypothetical protein